MCRPADVVFCRASCLLCCVLAQATHHRGEASCWHVVCSASSVLLCLRSLCVCRLPFVGRPGRAAIAAGAATSSCPRPAAVDSFSAAERQQGGAVGVAENSRAAREATTCLHTPTSGCRKAPQLGAAPGKPELVVREARWRLKEKRRQSVCCRT